MIMVVNHLHFVEDKTVDDIAAAFERDGYALLSSQPGFRGFYLTKADAHHGIVIILWDTPADAQNGSQQFGPTWFKDNIIPYLASEQERSFGPVVVGHTV